MLGIQLDTALLAIPNYANNELEAEDIVFRIIQWSRALLSPAGKYIARSSTADEFLWANSFYPARDQIAGLLELFDLQNYYSINDVVSAYNIIASRSIISEELFGLSIQECEISSCDPDVISEASPVDLQDETRKVFNLAIAVENYIPNVRCVIGTAFSADCGSEILIEGKISKISGQHPEITSKLPLQVSGKVRICTSLDRLENALLASDLWEIADSNDDYWIAILIGAVEMSKSLGLGLDIFSVPKFQIGSEFVSSLNQNQATGNGKFSSVVRDTVIRVILNCPKEPLKPFHLKSQLVRARDSATAFRTHVTKSSEGLRLMIWSRSDGIELANIGVKNDAKIAYCSAGAATQCPFN